MSSTYLKKKGFKYAYFRELQRYSFENIANILKIDSRECAEILKKLKYCGLIKSIRKSSNKIDVNELLDEEVILYEENLESTDVFYAFKFVGVITVNNCVIISYPKYIQNKDEPEEEIKQILKVLKKYDADKQYISLCDGNLEDDSFNFLSLVLFIIGDFFENGFYSNYKEIIEENGDGDILWDRTISENNAYMINGKPYYLEFIRKRTIEDVNSYFNRLHKYIISECFEMLSESKLDKLFEIESYGISEGNIDELGDIEYILYRIEQELKSQYITKKQNVLKALYAYILKKKSNKIEIGFNIYGTTSFNLVWEKVCAKVFDNKLNTRLKDLPLQLSEKYKNLKDNTLLEIIEKPIWRTYEKGEKSDRVLIERKASRTLTPDLISIYKSNDKYGLAIFDAKYYCITFKEDKVYNQPGVEDVNKQYLYRLAYDDFIKSNGYEFLMNAFLLPSEEEKVLNIGEVEMSILSGISSMKSIDLIKLPAMKIFDLYINDNIIEFSDIIGSKGITSD